MGHEPAVLFVPDHRIDGVGDRVLGKETALRQLIKSAGPSSPLHVLDFDGSASQNDKVHGSPMFWGGWVRGVLMRYRRGSRLLREHRLRCVALALDVSETPRRLGTTSCQLLDQGYCASGWWGMALRSPLRGLLRLGEPRSPLEPRSRGLRGLRRLPRGLEARARP